MAKELSIPTLITQTLMKTRDDLLWFSPRCATLDYMTIWAIVPVKPLRRGKSRLAGLLSEEQRTCLNRYLLEHTLTRLK